MGECEEREELSPFPEYKLKASCNHIAGMQSVYTVKHSLSPGSTSLSQHCTQRSLCSLPALEKQCSVTPSSSSSPLPHCSLPRSRAVSVILLSPSSSLSLSASFIHSLSSFFWGGPSLFFSPPTPSLSFLFLASVWGRLFGPWMLANSQGLRRQTCV